MDTVPSQASKTASLWRNIHLWTITALMVLLTLSYYANDVGLLSWANTHAEFLTSEYIHDLHRSLFLIPMVYAALAFRLRGAVVISLLTTATILPRGIYISDNPDSLTRTIIFGAVATLATVMLGLERVKVQDLDKEAQEHKLALESLRQQRDFTSALVETVGAIVVVMDTEGRIIRFNKAAEQTTGYSFDEVAGKRVWDMLLIPEEREPVKSVFDDILSGAFPNQFENYWVAKDGARRRIAWSNTALLDSRGTVEYVITTGIDITERKLYEIILAESEVRYRTIFENASDGIYLRDLQGNIIVANEAMSHLTGYTVDQLKHMNIRQFLTPDGLEFAMKEQAARLVDGGRARTQIDEFRFLRSDGTERIVEVVTSILGVGETQLPLVQAIARDFTEQKKAQETVRIYASLVMQAQEEERKRIARELHDETVQSLARLALDIDQLIGTRRIPQELVKALEDLRNRTDEILKGVRRFSQDLRPPMLEDLGLLDTLQWMADDLARQTDFSVSVHVTGTPRRLSPQKELALFRIAQEALNNIKKHANATETTVKIEFGQQEVKLSITDNGKGFEVPRGVGYFARLGKLGMMGMQERATLAGGSLDVNSDPATGTTVTVSINT